MKTTVDVSKNHQRDGRPSGTLIGVDVYENSHIRLYATLAFHTEPETSTMFSQDHPDFPIAHAGNLTATNMDIVVVIARLRPSDDFYTGGMRFRYYHRDSRNPHDGRDLKTFYRLRIPPTDKAIEELLALLMASNRENVTAPPYVLSFKACVPISEVCEAIAASRGVHSVPAEGVR